MSISTQTSETKFLFGQDNDVLVSLNNRRMVITLNKTKTLNALTISMIKTIYMALKDVRDNHSADIVILKSSIDKAFCAGGDVLEIKRSVETNGTTHKIFYIYEYIVDHMIGTMKVPFVSIINGITMGAGCGLSVNGRFRVATEKAVLAMPEVGIGLFPDAGATFTLPRLPNQMGIFIALTGYRLKGADNYHSGMATHYVESNKLAALESNLLSMRSPTNEKVEALLNTFQSKKIPDFSLFPYLDEINQTFGQKTLDDLIVQLENSGTEFARKQLDTIQKMNPISLKVTFNQLQMGKTLKFSDVFAIEYRLIQRLVASPNFLEGCRSILIDKDNQPKWIPSHIKDVTEKQIQAYYEPLSVEFSFEARL